MGVGISFGEQNFFSLEGNIPSKEANSRFKESNIPSREATFRFKEANFPSKAGNIRYKTVNFLSEAGSILPEVGETSVEDETTNVNETFCCTY